MFSDRFFEFSTEGVTLGWHPGPEIPEIGAIDQGLEPEKSIVWTPCHPKSGSRGRWPQNWWPGLSFSTGFSGFSDPCHPPARKNSLQPPIQGPSKCQMCHFLTVLTRSARNGLLLDPFLLKMTEKHRFWTHFREHEYVLSCLKGPGWEVGPEVVDGNTRFRDFSKSADKIGTYGPCSDPRVLT